MSEDNNLLAPMVFDSPAPVRIPVTVNGKNYMLLEASAAAGALYRSFNAKFIRFEDGDMSGLEGVGEADPYLVSLCLCYTDDGKEPKLDKHANPVTVGIGTVKGWKDEVVKALTERIKKLSPSLDEMPTLASIDKQIAKLQKHRAKLVKEEQAKEAARQDPLVESPTPTASGTST